MENWALGAFYTLADPFLSGFPKKELHQEFILLIWLFMFNSVVASWYVTVHFFYIRTYQSLFSSMHDFSFSNMDDLVYHYPNHTIGAVKLILFLYFLAATVANLTDLGFLWFREFYLESSRVIQVEDHYLYNV